MVKGKLLIVSKFLKKNPRGTKVPPSPGESHPPSGFPSNDCAVFVTRRAAEACGVEFGGYTRDSMRRTVERIVSTCAIRESLEAEDSAVAKAGADKATAAEAGLAKAADDDATAAEATVATAAVS